MKKATGEAIAISRLINSFLTVYVPLQENQSENTRRSHETALSLYVGFLEHKQGIGPETLVGDCFGREMIEKWMLWLRGSRRCSPETCNVRLASLRAFLKYVGGKEVSMLHLIQAASGIPRMKETKRKVSGLSRIAVQELLETPDIYTPTGRRDLALMVTLYGTAARLDEVLSMKIKHLHIHAQDPSVTIIGKGNKIRTLNLLPKAVDHLVSHIGEFHGDSPNPDAFVFYSRNTGIYGKLSQTAISSRLKMYAKAAHALCADVPLDLHAHQLRHARASHWLEDGINIMQISLLLGHEQLETTMVYLDVSMEQKAAAVETIKDDSSQKLQKKWKSSQSRLAAFCGVNPIKT